MNPSDLIGKPEGQLLEFKAADALKNLPKLAREVVAMLNASNGRDVAELWIGVSESESVAVKLEGVADAERERGRLRDTLVDTIEPRPTGEEVDVTIEDAGAATRLIRVTVCSTAARKPFALNTDGRHYLQRVQDRIAPMTYDELRDAWGRSPALQDAEVDARSWLNTERARTANDFLRRGVLWMALTPTREFASLLSKEVGRELLSDSARVAVRPHGRTFIRRADEVRDCGSYLVAGRNSAPFSTLELHLTGRIATSLYLVDIAKPPGSGLAAGPQEIDPIALCEYSVSVVRLASAVATTLGAKGQSDWLVAMGVFKRSGWVLPPADSLDRDRWLSTQAREVGRGAPDVVMDPLRFMRSELVGHPDACAFRLLVLLFRQFGLTADKLPREFDPVTGRLMLD